MTIVTDRIDKEIILAATPARVWRAVATAEEFGAWFGMRFDGPFAPGATIHAQVTTPGYEHLSCNMFIETMEEERRFAYRWHAHAWVPDRDYSNEPTTLVEFRLEPVDGGTKLTITESGFDQVPEEFRVESFTRNDGGWTIQLGNIERHVTTS